LSNSLDVNNRKRGLLPAPIGKIENSSFKKFVAVQFTKQLLWIGKIHITNSKVDQSVSQIHVIGLGFRSPKVLRLSMAMP
jgi:hypothetical protein